MLKVGNGNINISGGEHYITEIQGNGSQDLNFAHNFTLVGNINSTGG